MTNQGLIARNTVPSELRADEISAWENLVATTPALSSPFLTVHYARAVAESGMDVRVCVIYQKDRICGFFPYQYRNRYSSWAKAAEPVGGEMTDYFGLAADPDMHITPACLLRLAKINHLSFSHLDETQLRYGLTGEQPRIGLRARLSTIAEQPLEALISAQHRYLKDSERCARKLSNEFGAIEFNFDVQLDRQAILEDLISQKRMQYQKTSVPDSLKDLWKRKLLHILSNYRFSSCRGVLSTLSANGQTIASHFGIMGNGVFQYWFPVYAPEFSRYAPGRLLLHKIIESSKQTCIHTIDHGEGDTASKRELANEEHHYFRGAWHNRSMASSVTRGFLSIKWRLGV